MTDTEGSRTVDDRTPRTEAGRDLLARFAALDASEPLLPGEQPATDNLREIILAIEAELDEELLARVLGRALLDQDFTGFRNWPALAAEIAAEYARLRPSPEPSASHDKHPLTCDWCDWGREPANYDSEAFRDHMATEHPGLPYDKPLPRPEPSASGLDVERFARAFAKRHLGEEAEPNDADREEAALYAEWYARLAATEAPGGWREASRRLHAAGDDEPYATDDAATEAPGYTGPERRVKDDPLIPQWEERRGR